MVVASQKQLVCVCELPTGRPRRESLIAVGCALRAYSSRHFKGTIGRSKGAGGRLAECENFIASHLGRQAEAEMAGQRDFIAGATTQENCRPPLGVAHLYACLKANLEGETRGKTNR